MTEIEKDKWVNAVIEIIVPLDNVTPDSSIYEQQEAASEVLEDVADDIFAKLPDAVLTARTEVEEEWSCEE